MKRKKPLQSPGVPRLLTETLYSVKAWLKVQILLAALTGLLLWGSFSWMGLPYAFLTALMIGLFDLLPVVGSPLIFVVWGAFCLLSGQSGLAFQLALVCIGLSALRMFAEPKLLGQQMGLHPLLAMGISLGSALFLGPLGVLAGPLLTALLSAYLRLRSLEKAKNQLQRN